MLLYTGCPFVYFLNSLGFLTFCSSTSLIAVTIVEKSCCEFTRAFMLCDTTQTRTHLSQSLRPAKSWTNGLTLAESGLVELIKVGQNVIRAMQLHELVHSLMDRQVILLLLHLLESLHVRFLRQELTYRHRKNN